MRAQYWTPTTELPAARGFNAPLWFTSSWGQTSFQERFDSAWDLSTQKKKSTLQSMRCVKLLQSGLLQANTLDNPL